MGSGFVSRMVLFVETTPYIQDRQSGKIQFVVRGPPCNDSQAANLQVRARFILMNVAYGELMLSKNDRDELQKGKIIRGVMPSILQQGGGIVGIDLDFCREVSHAG